MNRPVGIRIDAGRYHGCGVIADWQPLGTSMTDTLVNLDDGRRVWFAIRELRALDGSDLPSRDAARRTCDVRALTQLREIKQRHIAGFHTPWPGCEHGKAIVSKAICRAIEETEARMRTK